MNKILFNNQIFEILTLFSTDLKIKLHGRKIAKLLNANQRTVLLNLNKLEESKILNSNMNGKNKEFSLNLEYEMTFQILNMTEQYKFIRLQEKHFFIYSLIKDLKKIIDEPIIIYGSYANQTQTKHSDIDILIVGKPPKHEAEYIIKSSIVKVHFVNLSKKDFIDGIKKDEPYMKSVVKNHVIPQGAEEFIKWRIKYEQDKVVR